MVGTPQNYLAVIKVIGVATITEREISEALAEEGRRLASVLVDQGTRPGDRVAVHLPNGADYVRILLACAAGLLVVAAVTIGRWYHEQVRDQVREAPSYVSGFTVSLTVERSTPALAQTNP